MSLYLKDDDALTKRRNLFCESADRIKEIYRSYGLQISGYRSRDLPLFSALSESVQKEVLLRLRVFLDSLEEAESFGERVDSSDKSAWHALVTMELTPPSNLFSHIKSSSLIEIYDFEGHQIWRNFQFMKYCSYTLEEVHCLEWYKRYRRDESVNELCFKKVNALLTGQISGDMYCPDIPRHKLEETSSSSRLVLDVKYDLLCILKDKVRGTPKAWMVVTSADIIGQKEISIPTASRERNLYLAE
ncbi:MAG: hypothetical protein M9962_03945 [Oligoflexia bacterium]|nr:hypothetical protein [Oligoflexia bacterium]